MQVRNMCIRILLCNFENSNRTKLEKMRKNLQFFIRKVLNSDLLLSKEN